jgi:hypothetical protein
MRRSRWRGAAGLLLLACIACREPVPPPALEPRPATGSSGIEQRYVYAPPGKGSFELPLSPGVAAPLEVRIETPETCNGTANVRISYDKARNEVILEAAFRRALPFRFDFTRPEDVSTRFNRWPVSVQDGKWQIWFVGRILTVELRFFYDRTTMELLGSEFDFPNGPPPNSFPVPIPVSQMVCSPIFEGNKAGDADVRVKYRYDQILDSIGSGGVYVTFLPFNLCQPDKVGPYYTNGGLPVSRAMTMDDVLDSIHRGYGIGIGVSLEPDPKPDYLAARDNIMISWVGYYPGTFERGTRLSLTTGSAENINQCGRSEAIPDFPPAYYDLCANRTGGTP